MTHVIFTLTRVEAAHLTDLVGQFQQLVSEPVGDPALERLTPDVYPDDADASSEFRQVTRADLLGRRAHDAATVAGDLGRVEDASVSDALSPVDISIADLDPWLRTLSALRLVLASRLGIADGDEHDDDDPAYGLYEWLGYRLEGLVQVAEQDDS